MWKIPKKNIFRLIALGFTLLLTLNWALNYLSPSFLYPFSRKGQTVQVYPYEVAELTDAPIKTKANIEIYFEGTTENTFRVETRYTMVLNSTGNCTFISGPILPVRKVIDYELVINGERLNLTVGKSRELGNLRIFFPENNTWISDQGELEDYYFAPSFEILGENRVNTIEESLTVLRTFGQNTMIEAPLFFSDSEYARVINIPWHSVPLEKNGTSELITVESHVDMPFYRILKEFSGWTGWFTLRKYWETDYLGPRTFNGTTFQMPIQQNVTQYGSVVTFETVFSNDTRPSNLLLTVVPDSRIFLIPLLFFWAPQFSILLVSLREKDNDEKRNYKSTALIIISVYACLFITFLGVNAIQK